MAFIVFSASQTGQPPIKNRGFFIPDINFFIDNLFYVDTIKKLLDEVFSKIDHEYILKVKRDNS